MELFNLLIMLYVVFSVCIFASVSGQNIYGSYQYFVKPRVQNHATAVEECQTSGGILAVIYNSTLNDFIGDLIDKTAPIFSSSEQTNAFWIGLRRTGSGSSDFSWDDGSPLTYNNWGATPTTSQSQCVIYSFPCCKIQTWWNTNCNLPTRSHPQPGYICQKSIDKTTTSPTTTVSTTPDVTTSTMFLSTSIGTTHFSTSETTSKSDDSKQSTVSTQSLSTTELKRKEKKSSLVFFPIVVAILLVAVLLVAAIWFARRKFKKRMRLKKEESIKQGIYDSVPVKNETNLYETPMQDENYLDVKKRDPNRISTISQADSFDDDLPEENPEEKIFIKDGIQEGNYSSVSEINENTSSYQVPLSMRKIDEEENPYSLPDQQVTRPTENNSFNVYDALSCNS